ncbi:MAG TPA: tetratricopeptide repeat protein [Thermoanaerobaculia bacterium]|nr:tetratricopeptide repeat protein [Thermoanaerobaculia bacterium]
MSTYPGNASLAAAVKDRVVATYDQILALYRQGRTDDVVAGCNLILQMDPLFDPARKLLDQVSKPSAGAVASEGDDPLAEARQALEARDFERVIQITTDVLTSDLMNDEARVLSDTARERIEAAPFVDQFVRKCQEHAASGNLTAARGDLEKARTIDPHHPGVAQIEEIIRKAEGAPRPSSDSSSFVVDTPPTSPRAAAQASDFGFTFEEEKGSPGASSFENFSFDTGGSAPPASPAEAPPAGGFSFDAPVESPAAAPTPPFNFDAPAAGAGNEFDFSTASIETSPDDQKKIEQYLADGDRAFDGADYQQAIDLWSRIFLIDVTNEAASERIEKAKGKRREIEQRMETVLAAGIEAFDRKDFTTARTSFEEVLRNDPGNIQAQDYLERLEVSPTGEPAFAPPPPPSFDAVLEDEEIGIGGAPIAPPAPAARKAAAPKPAVAAAKKRPPLAAIAAVFGVLVVGAAGWFVWSRVGGGEPEQTPAATQALISRAGSLGQEGKFDEAIAVLRDVQPGDGNYETALAMIAELQQKKGRAGTEAQGRPAAAFYDDNIAAGRTAFAAHDYAGAKRAFENAMRVKPLPPDLKAPYDTASEQVAKLGTAQRLFEERRYAEAISSLQALRREDPRNRNVQRMIIDAHFNRGAQALQQDRLQEAIRAFDAVLQEDPNDEFARRSKELAQRYQGQPRDLLFRIYVKYLPLRQAAA